MRTLKVDNFGGRDGSQVQRGAVFVNFRLGADFTAAIIAGVGPMCPAFKQMSHDGSRN